MIIALILYSKQDHCRGVYLPPSVKGEEILCGKNSKERKMYTRNMKPCKTVGGRIEKLVDSIQENTSCVMPTHDTEYKSLLQFPRYLQFFVFG